MKVPTLGSAYYSRQPQFGVGGRIRDELKTRYRNLGGASPEEVAERRASMQSVPETGGRDSMPGPYDGPDDAA